MIDEAVLEERLTKLEAAKNWSPRVVSRLETLIRSGPDEAVFRINPIRFAAERGIAENEAIDLFLHATLAGLVEMDWLLYCPVCSDVVANFRSLRAVHNHYHCHLCQADYEATLDDYIAVTFTVQPAVRPIRYHDPNSLAAEDYAYYYKGTTEGLTGKGFRSSTSCGRSRGGSGGFVAARPPRWNWRRARRAARRRPGERRVLSPSR